MSAVHLLIDSLEDLTSGTQPGGNAGRPAYHPIQHYETLNTFRINGTNTGGRNKLEPKRARFGHADIVCDIVEVVVCAGTSRQDSLQHSMFRPRGRVIQQSA